MLDAFYISALGLQAQKEQLDATAQNFANVNTTGFKRQTVDFSALLDRAPAGSPASVTRSASATGSARAVRIDLAQGELQTTGRPLDVALSGAGFIEVDLDNGETGYIRGGSLQIDDNGSLTDAAGHALHADIRIPRGSTAVDIRADGTVQAMQAGDRVATVVGQIDVVRFANPESLIYRGGGVFGLREGLSAPDRSLPGVDGAGTLVAGSLEGSNVHMVDELVGLMLMQRVYELNAKVLQAADDMMGQANNLRRGG